MSRIFFVFCLFFTFSFSGCAKIQSVESSPRRIYSFKKGIYHKLRRGETLWRIAQSYNVSLEEIIHSNNIPNAAKVEENQLIFIPGALSPKEIAMDTQGNQNEFIWPVQGKILRYFHEKQADGLNQGIDIEKNPKEPVRAARSGRVVFVDYLSGYGPTIIIKHEDGFYSIYSCQGSVKVKLSEVVARGHILFEEDPQEDIAYLHFQIRRDGTENNPLYYLP